MNKLKSVSLLALVGVVLSLMMATGAAVLADWVPGDGHKMHYPQLPDEAGWDVNATGSLIPPVVLADDWMCSETGWVKDIHFWGSWLEGFEGVIDSFVLSIHANIPATPDTPYSHPGPTLWEWVTNDFVTVGPITSSEWEGWYDPSTGMWNSPDHNTYFQYNIFLPDTEWFWQDSGTVYWLNISALVADSPGGDWGWKSSLDHWQDNACWALWGELNWQPMFEPPDFIQSLDLAFVITGDTLGPVEEFDFGDAPDPTYPTLLASNGARHTIVPGIFLGASIDPEADGQPNPNALGDDNNNLDDEDGVVFTSLVIQGQPATLKVTASVAGFLDAWVDFNADGDWADPGEQIFASQALVAGVNILTFNVPAGAVTGITYSRFRFSTTGGLSYTGAASDGEVEDYRVFILHPVENIKMHWPQLPDLDNTGMDVDMYSAPLADDWQCTETGPVTDIHFWGSFADDILPADGVGSLTFQLTIHANIPAGVAADWSMPGDILWTRTFGPGQYQVYQVADNNPEDWYDPVTGLWLNDNHLQVYQYEFYIDEDPFVQDSGAIYWLEVKDIPPPDDYTFGWKTTEYGLRFMDDATWLCDPPAFWCPLTYPDGHEYQGATLDLAFVITGRPTEGAFIRGDYDENGQLLTNDPLMELQFIFGVPGATPPSCEDAADYDDDGNILTNDPLMALQFIFGVPGSVPPQPPYGPFPGGCGPDPTDDDLTCADHACQHVKTAPSYRPSVSVPNALNKLVLGEPTFDNGKAKAPLDLTVNEPVCGFDISISYNASSLRFEEVIGGSGYDFWAVDTRQAGVVRIGAVPDIEMVKLLKPGTHRVGEVVFEVEQKGDLGLNWEKAEVYGSQVEPLSVEWVVKAGVGNLPTEFALAQNYPNPFNLQTAIRYQIPEDCLVTLEVYNLLGQKVRTLVSGEQKANYYTAYWDGKDAKGNEITSGIYFYTLKAGNFTQTRKMVILK